MTLIADRLRLVVHVKPKVEVALAAAKYQVVGMDEELDSVSVTVKGDLDNKIC